MIRAAVTTLEPGEIVHVHVAVIIKVGGNPALAIWRQSTTGRQRGGVVWDALAGRVQNVHLERDRWLRNITEPRCTECGKRI